jgi:pyruvate/2-oxoglutarate dehydrogenase complex dihydrolipoamide acyltransferase (E2) component
MPSEYRTVPYSPVQHQSVDWNAVMSSQHTVHGLVEFDVTETRRAIHALRQKTGEPLSFTALIVASFAHVVGLDTSLQAYRKGKTRLVVFNDVDVAVLVEHNIEGTRIPIPHIVRAANLKSPRQIDDEIRAARNETDMYGRARRFLPVWLLLPAAIRRFAWRRLLASPHRRKRLTGTAAVSAVSMFGKGSGWGVPIISHSVCLTVGGVARRPGMGPGGRIEPRDTVCMTISIDHDVANGAPVARFVSAFRRCLETGELLATRAEG